MCTQRRLGQQAKLFYCAAATVAGFGIPRLAAAQSTPFLMGSDISLLSFFQQQGAVYHAANGQTLPADQILYNAGDNLFRLRIFVNPNTSYSATEGAIQTTAYDIALAQQLKADDPGAQLLLDFHYSDTWADPGHQTTPTEWGGANASLSSLETNLYNYTFNTLESFQAAGVMPNMVQLGNEINSGMDWNTGELNFSGGSAETKSWQALGGLLNQGIAAVRAAQGIGPKIQIAIHIANGAMDGEPQFYFNDLQTLGGVTGYDIEGVSFYPGNGNGATLSMLQSNLTALADMYPTKKIMVLETNYPYQNFSGNTYTGYADTPAGQQQELQQVASVIQNLPNNTGEGVVYWYPESIQLPGLNVYNGGNTALFSSNGTAEPAVSDFGITMANESWTPTSGASWSGGENWSNFVPPRQAGDEVTFGSNASGSVTLDGAWTVGAVTFNNTTSSYTLLPGSGGTLTLDNGGITATASITNSGGAHTISAPVMLNSNLLASVKSTGDTLSLNGAIGGAGAVTISGAGTVVFGGSNSYSGATTVSSGTLTLAAPGAIPAGGSLINNSTVSITGGSSAAPIILSDLSGSGALSVNGFLQLPASAGPVTQGMLAVSAGATLDLTNNKLVINYAAGADPTPAIAAALASGFSAGAWNGSGIVSSLAAGNPTFSVGYADGNNPADSQAGAAANQLVIKYTLAGDATLQNSVGFSDLVVVAENFGKTGEDWVGGNFNYDPAGSVGFADLVIVAENFGLSSGVSQGASGDGLSPAWEIGLASTAVVPEPCMAGLLFLGAAGFLIRRRRPI